MKYHLIVDTYKKIEETSKRLEMTDYLTTLLRQTNPDLIDKVIYLTRGELYPDYVGKELGMAEKLTIKAIAQTSGLSEKNVIKKCREIGDLGSIAESVLEEKKQTTLLTYEKELEKNLTVEKVYENFDKIIHISGSGSIDKKISYLVELLHSATPLEAKYLVRTVDKRLRLGIADMTILDSLAIAFATKEDRSIIERAYNIHPDMGYIAKTLVEDGLKKIKKIKVSLDFPIRSMLAERLSSLEDILKKMGEKTAFEYKYDGLRIQAHVGEDVRLYSRRSEDISSQFPDIISSLKESISSEVILDAEAVPINPETDDILPFQTVSHRRGRKYALESYIEDYPVVLFVFDILYLDGKDLTKSPYPKRRKALEKLLKKSEKIRLAKQIITDDLNEAQEFFEHAIENGCEGIVAKDTSQESIYQAGSRDWLWIKYKRDYRVEITDTLDLVAVGAYAGRGRRSGKFGALLMASYNKEKDVFETVCKLGSGFTDENLDYIQREMRGIVLTHKHPRVISDLTPDYWLEPKYVLEVTASEITKSPTHTACKSKFKNKNGLAVRFPRFTSWRTDKSPEESTTCEELFEMYNMQSKS